MANGSLSERIQAAMDARGMTQADLARATGFSTAVVSQIVSGKTKDPRFLSVIEIARALGFSLEYLAGIDGCRAPEDDEEGEDDGKERD